MVNRSVSLRVERTIAAPPDRVWRALTDPVALAAWFWPAGLEPKVHADARPGGTYRIESTARGMAVGGGYLTVEPPHRLVFTWSWDGEDEETLVTIDLSAVEGGTSFVLTHERFTDTATRDNHHIGWVDCLDRLLTDLTGAWSASRPCSARTTTATSTTRPTPASS